MEDENDLMSIFGSNTELNFDSQTINLFQVYSHDFISSIKALY